MFLIVESKIDDDAEIRCSIFSYSRAQSFLQKISKAVLSDNQNLWKTGFHRLSKVRSRSGPAPFCGPRTRTSGPGPANPGPGPGPVLDLVLGPVQVRSRSGPGHEYCGVILIIYLFFINIYILKNIRKSSLSLLSSPNWFMICCSANILDL